MKKTAKTIILSASALILVVLVVLSIISYVKINTKYPQIVIKRYALGDTMSFTDYDITVKDAKMYDYWDFQKEYDYVDNDGDEMYVDEHKVEVALFTIEVTNTTDETVAFPRIEYFTLETDDGFSTPMDITMFRSFYDYDISLITDDLEPRETRTITAIYSIRAKYVNSFNGILLDIKDFDLVVSLYPVKNYYDFAG